MIALLLALIISLAAVTSLTVLALSGRRAFAAFRELRHALSTCPEIVTVEVRIVQPVLRPNLRLISQTGRPHARPAGALRAAA